MRTPRRRGCIAQLFLLVILCLALVYAVAAITSPWSFHIGGVPGENYTDRQLPVIRSIRGIQSARAKIKLHLAA